MGTTYYVNKSINLFGTYVCSKCKSVILMQFVLKAGGASTWSQKKAQEATEEPTQKVLQALQNFSEKPFLVTNKMDGRTFTTGYELQLEEAANGCPCCGNKEIWQRGYEYAAACRMDPVTGVSLVNDCPERSRMAVFSSLDVAKEHAGKLLAFTSHESKLHWEANPEEAEKLKARITELGEQITALEPRKASAKDLSKSIFEQIQKKEAEMKGYSLFSAEKKAAKAELKELNKKYNAQKDADIVQERKLDAEIKELEKQKKELLLANPGVTGETEVFNSKGLILRDAYRYS